MCWGSASPRVSGGEGINRHISQTSPLMDVAARCAEMPEVDYVVITAGAYDILIETVCEDNEGLLRFLADRLRTIDGVRETETFVYLRMVKQSYQWGTR